MTPSARQWLVEFAERLGIDAPSDTECEEILALAGIAAHSSERTAAPVACWLAARAGLSVADALDVANSLVAPDSNDA